MLVHFSFLFKILSLRLLGLVIFDFFKSGFCLDINILVLCLERILSNEYAKFSDTVVVDSVNLSCFKNVQL